MIYRLLRSVVGHLEVLVDLLYTWRLLLLLLLLLLLGRSRALIPLGLLIEKGERYISNEKMKQQRDRWRV